MEVVLKMLPVFLISMLKFFGGPIMGVSIKLSFWLTWLATTLGMITSVFIVAYLGKYTIIFLSRFKKPNAKRFSKMNRNIVKVWQRFGLIGIAFLTPPLLTPIGGTIIALSFGEAPFKIFTYMVASAIVWGFVVCIVLFELKKYIPILW